MATNQLLRRKMGQWERLDGFTAAHAASLRVKSGKQSFDALTFKPKFKARIIPGGIRFDWKKRGVDGVFVFCRLAGQPNFTKIGVDTMSPFLDARPLATPGVAEVREYLLRGMVNDAASGLDSDIVSVTWNGAVSDKREKETELTEPTELRRKEWRPRDKLRFARGPNC